MSGASTSGWSGVSGVGTSGFSGVSGPSGAAGGGVTWLEKSANYTANNLEGIIADTTAGEWTLKLPSSPSVGDSVSVIDAMGTFASNNLTIDAQGEKIQEEAEDLECDINNLNIELVYTGSTDGWKVRTFPGFTSGESGYSGFSGYIPVTYTWVISSPAVGGIPGPRIPMAKTVDRVDSYTTAATNMWFNIEHRSTIGSAGTDVLSADLVAGVSGAMSSGFASSSLPSGSWLWVDIAGVSGTPGTGVITMTVK